MRSVTGESALAASGAAMAGVVPFRAQAPPGRGEETPARTWWPGAGSNCRHRGFQPRAACPRTFAVVRFSRSPRYWRSRLAARSRHRPLPWSHNWSQLQDGPRNLDSPVKPVTSGGPPRPRTSVASRTACTSGPTSRRSEPLELPTRSLSALVRYIFWSEADAPNPNVVAAWWPAGTRPVATCSVAAT